MTRVDLSPSDGEDVYATSGITRSQGLKLDSVLTAFPFRPVPFHPSSDREVVGWHDQESPLPLVDMEEEDLPPPPWLASGLAILREAVSLGQAPQVCTSREGRLKFDK